MCNLRIIVHVVRITPVIRTYHMYYAHYRTYCAYYPHDRRYCYVFYVLYVHIACIFRIIGHVNVYTYYAYMLPVTYAYF